MRKEHKSKKKTVKSLVSFYAFGICTQKAAHKMLAKLAIAANTQCYVLDIHLYG